MPTRGDASLRKIRELPFRSNARDKRGLEFEIFQVADLYEREARAELHTPLAMPARLGFHVMYVGLEGNGQHVIDFTRGPLGAGFVTVSAKGRVQQFVRDRSVNAWMVLFTSEFIDLPELFEPAQRAGVPMEYMWIIWRGLVRDREKRYQSVGELEAALSAVQDGRIEVQCNITWTKSLAQRFVHWIDRHPKLFTLLFRGARGVAVLAAAGGIGVAVRRLLG